MRIDVLHVPDCPSMQDARSRLRAALDKVGLAAEVFEREVTSVEEAEAVGMNGSPTFLGDGRDLFGGDASYGCRLYRDGDHVDGAPSIAALVEALSR